MKDDEDPRTWPVDLSPDEPTVISQAPFLMAIPLPPRAGDDEPIPEGGEGTTTNGYRWLRRDGYFYTRDDYTPEELANADDYYECGYSRAEVEAKYGQLTAVNQRRHVMFSAKFLRDALERALSTAAQSALLAVGANQINVLDADWSTVGGFAAGGAFLALLKALAAGATVGSPDSASLDPKV